MAVDRERRHQRHRQMIMAKYKGICHICSEPFSDAIDHVVPVAKGGSDHPDNLRPAHTSCNSKKGARSYPKWAENNPNMWEPEHLPEVTRRNQEAEEARNRAKWQRELERYERLSAAWAEKSQVLAVLQKDKPSEPFSGHESHGAFGFGLVGVAITILVLIFHFDVKSAAGLFFGTAVFGLIGFLVFGFAGLLAWTYVESRLLPVVFKRQFQDYEVRLLAWQALVASWSEKEPKTAPVHPGERIRSNAPRSSRKTSSKGRPKTGSYRHRR